MIVTRPGLKTSQKSASLWLVLPVWAIMLVGLGPATAQPKPAPGLGQAATPSPAASLIRDIAVFGTDDRVALPIQLGELRRSVGLLFNNQARTVCTAFCVAKNVVASASHCLFRTSGERRPKLSAFRFALKADLGTPSSLLDGAKAGAVSQNVMAGGLNLRVAPPIDASRDWALIRLAKPMCKGASLPLISSTPEDIGRLAAEQKLFQVSFHRDFGDWKLGYSSPCTSRDMEPKPTRQSIEADFSSPSDLVLHRCDTGGASSGSPLMTMIDGQPQVLAVNVGTYVQTRLMMRGGKVVHRFRADAIANTAVSARAFKRFVGRLNNADILTLAGDIRALQTRLRTLGFYSGAIDGSYGPKTRNAIIDYQIARKTSSTGLATRALLRELRTGAAQNSSATSQINLRSAHPSFDRSGVALQK